MILITVSSPRVQSILWCITVCLMSRTCMSPRLTDIIDATFQGWGAPCTRGCFFLITWFRTRCTDCHPTNLKCEFSCKRTPEQGCFLLLLSFFLSFSSSSSFFFFFFFFFFLFWGINYFEYFIFYSCLLIFFVLKKIKN
jgi:hypothetical protein